MDSSSSSSSSAAAAAATGNGAADPADGGDWDPWSKVAPGKTPETSREHLQTQFTVAGCGGLKCNTCVYVLERGKMEGNTAAGNSGALTNHLKHSNQHAAAVNGQQNKAAGTGLHAFLRPKPAAAGGQDGGAAAASSAAASSSSAAAAPTGSGACAARTRAWAATAGPRARPGRLLIESVDEEEEQDEGFAAAAATSLIDTFNSLPARSKSSVAQQMITGLARCQGFRPPSLDGVVDLLTHVPPAFFYTSGSYGTTNLERVSGVVQLRQHNFHAVGCQEVADAGSSMCGPCSTVVPSSLDRRMPFLKQPAAAINAKMNDAHYSQYQMKEKKDAFREEERRKSLQLLTLGRKVDRQERALGVHDRLLVALTRGSARLMQAALVQARNAGHGVVGVLQMVTKCLEGVYKPRSRFTDRDMGIASLLYTFGGAAGAYAANKGLGLPCERLIRKAKEMAAFVPVIYTGVGNYAGDVKKAVAANLRNSIGQPILDGKLGWRQCFAGQWMMPLDGTANDKTLSFHSQSGTMVGGCEHKPEDITLTLTTPDDGKAALAAVRLGQEEPASSRAMHLAGETVVVGFKPIAATGEDAPLFPAAAVPTCNKRSCIKLSKELLTGALDGFDAVRDLLREERQFELGEVVTIATDGDGKRRRAITALCNALEGKVPAVELLLALDLFDTYGGELQVTVDFDARHMIKRIRVRLIFTDRGMQLSPLGVKFDRAKIKELFQDYSVPHLASVFDNTDKQNVPAAVGLLRGFRWVADAQQGLIPTKKTADICLLAALGDHLLKPMIGGVDGKGTEVSLEDALVSYAAAAFILFVIFSEMGTDFIPSQLYHDLQSSIKNLFVVVARQLDDPKNEGAARLLFFLVGTDELEKLFGTLRRLSPGLTFNLLQLLDRIGAAALVQAIYAKYPDLDPGSRRLEGSNDKVNAASWRGALKVVGDGILLSCWQRGRRLALDVLSQHYHYGAKEMVDGVEMTRAEIAIRRAKEKGGTMMRPKGRLVGVSVHEGGDLEEGEEEEDEGVEDLAAGAEESETVEAEAEAEEGEPGVAEAGVEESETAEEEAAAAVAASLGGMEDDLREAMEQERLQALALVAGDGALGGALGVEMQAVQAAVAVAQRAAERQLYFFLPGGKKQHKAQWMREEMGQGGVGTTRGSADRVARYQGMEKGSRASGSGTGGAGSSNLVPVEMEERVVAPGDPVVFGVLTDCNRETDVAMSMVTVKGKLGVGVGEIVSIQNKKEGRGRLAFLREDLFKAADTIVQVRPIEVAAVGTTQGVEEVEPAVELRLEEYTTRHPFTFKGGRLVGLLKPDVVQKEDGDRTQHVFQVDLIHLKERLDLLAEELRLVGGGGARALERLLPVARGASVAQAGSVDVVLWKEKDEKVVKCQPCQQGNDPSTMLRKNLRAHAAGHLFLSSWPKSRCGFCGLPLAQTRCSVEVKGGKLESTCSFKLPGFRYGQYAREREEELQGRLALQSEAAVAAATKAGLGLEAKGEARRPTVRNIPIPCPMSGCSEHLWKLNIIPHLLEDGHPLPLEGRAPRWRRRGRAVLKELHTLITQSPRAEKYALREGSRREAAEKLEEVRNLLAVAGQQLSTTVSFCLEEVVRESQPALATYHTTRGPLEGRKSAPKAKRKGTGKSKGKGGADGGGTAAVLQGAGGGGDSEDSEDSEGDDDSEDEEEGGGEGDESGAGGQGSNKRPADEEGVESAGKGKKPKKK